MEVDARPEILAGRYELGEVMGHGGMSVVRRATDRQLQRDVAVKLLRPAYAAHPDSRRRFEEEARAAARISHPSVVTVFDSGEDGDQAFLVMERLPGPTLADELRAGPVPQDRLRSIAVDLLGALAAAHAVGVVHRDVKPGNVLLTEEGSPKLADFGIAKTAEAPDLTATGLVVGTAWYVAPERLAGAPATPASDLYSLGVVLHEAAAGEKPHEGGPPLAVDPRLAAAIDRALQPDPALRFQSATEMLTAIADAPPTAPMPLAPTTVLTAPEATARRRPPWRLAALLAALVLAALAVAAFGIDRGADHPATTTSTTTTAPATTAPPDTSTTATTATTPPTPKPKPDKPDKGPGPGKRPGPGKGDDAGQG